MTVPIAISTIASVELMREPPIEKSLASANEGRFVPIF
jgi:hypothetical protein